MNEYVFHAGKSTVESGKPIFEDCIDLCISSSRAVDMIKQLLDEIMAQGESGEPVEIRLFGKLTKLAKLYDE